EPVTSAPPKGAKKTANSSPCRRSCWWEPEMETNRDLLFGVFALRFHLVDAAQLAEACEACATASDTSLPDLLVERGRITPADRAALEQALNLNLEGGATRDYNRGGEKSGPGAEEVRGAAYRV